MSRVILTMTTVPNRLSETRDGWGTRAALRRLLDMSYRDFELHLNIPMFCVGTGEEYIIPQWLREYNDRRLKVFRTEDYGSMTKLAPTVFRVDEPDAIIITVDDDLLYENGFIEYHLRMREKYPDAALGFAGLNAVYDPGLRFVTSMASDTRVKILEGYKTVSYLRRFFQDDFFTDFVGKHWDDDMVISAYLGKHHIQKIVLAYESEINYNARVESFPVINHLPVEAGGCNVFRQRGSTPEQQALETKFYQNQWLER